MIVTSRIIASIRQAGLDAGIDSDYYNDQEDIIPAINLAVRWLISVIDAARAKDKRVNEALKFLSATQVYQLNNLSRFTIPDTVWTIDSIMSVPVTTPNGNTPVTQPDVTLSVYRSDLTHVSSLYQATRQTIDEWNVGVDNPFQPGNIITQLPVGFDGSKTYNITFGYLDNYNYNNTVADFEIEIRPYIPNKLVSAFLIMAPTDVVLTTDFIQLPESIYTLIYLKALQIISFNQGDDTTLYTISDKDVATLIGAISK
jgi:hypothetical protein